MKRVLSWLMLTCALATLGLVVAPHPIEPASLDDAYLVRQTRTPASTPTPTITRTPTSTRTPTVTRTPANTRTPTQTLIPTQPAVRGFAVGDSVMLGAAPELQRVLPGLTVDAKVSRQMSAAIEVLRQRRLTGTPDQFVIVHIGDNGFIRADQFDGLMQLVKDVPLVIVFNLKEPRPWEKANNLIIADTVRRYPNAVLIDWRAISSEHPEYFGPDGIHIGTVGRRAYTLLVVEQLQAWRSIGAIIRKPLDNLQKCDR